MLKKMLFVVAVFGLVAVGYVGYGATASAQDGAEALGTSTSYTIVDTGQTVCYDNLNEISCPAGGQAFSGQDAQYAGNQPSYTLSEDGLTVYDNNTGLTWTQSPDLNSDGDIDVDDKLTFSEAQTYPDTLNAQNYGGYDDWRLPTIKELYSLIDFSGLDPSGPNPSTLIPFIDTDYFDFAYGDESAGERLIDAQYCSSTEYVGQVFDGVDAVFGVNFADGRIKGYPRDATPGGTKTYYVHYVRGNSDYDQNDFVDNGDGTITDQATGLMWMQADSGTGMNWEDALAYAENLDYAGYDDWRLPNAKELQSIVDYTRSPATTDSAAIDPLFSSTPIVDEAGDTNYPFYWTSTTHANTMNGSSAAYVAFGEALGYMQNAWIDVHGAGAQRSDPKTGDPDDYPYGHGPQGDAVRIFNYVRAVRDTSTTAQNTPPTAEAGGPYAGKPGSQIALNGSASTDPDGSIVLYEWDLDGDGQYDDATGAVASFSTGDSGTFTIGLRVTDDDGAQDVDTAIVNVTATSTESYTIYLPLVIKDGAEEGGGNNSGAYNLFTPLNSTTTYLVDGDGQVVYTWDSAYWPGNAVYLLENGNLLRTGNTGSNSFGQGGAGGIVEEIAPDDRVVWSFEYANDQHLLHHDVEPLPNGNVLMIAWEYKSEAEALAAGRDPALLTEGELWPDTVIEVNPDTNSIVWKWHVWDHLVQDYDVGKDNFGIVANHPELIDLNYSGPGTPPGGADWNHINSIDYHAEFDQILLSVRNFSEIWIIDHSTSTAEAAGHTGGDSGMGGDLLYRWGNPQAYDAGDASDQQLFVQHDAQWIPAGYPGEGNILVFNNGLDRVGRSYSSVDEIVPPVDAAGRYASYGPAAPAWTYTADNPTDLYAANISSAQRLPDGNTLICDGPNGYFFEVTPGGDVVWEYDYEGTVFRVTRYAADYPGLPEASVQQVAVPAVTVDAERPFASPSDAAPSPPQGQSPRDETGQRPDLATAAEKLSVTVEALRAALGEPGQGPPDLVTAAARLGVTVEALREALEMPRDGSPAGQRPGG